MIQVAFINLHGEINHWIIPGDDAMYGDSLYYDSFLAKHFEASADIDSFSKTNYWSFTNEEWTERDPKPTAFYRWEGEQWVFYAEELYQEVRILRNSRLSVCDWTQAVDSPLSEEQKEAWRTYRQELRDFMPVFIATGNNSLDNIPWPTPPN